MNINILKNRLVKKASLQKKAFIIDPEIILRKMQAPAAPEPSFLDSLKGNISKGVDSIKGGISKGLDKGNDFLENYDPYSLARLLALVSGGAAIGGVASKKNKKRNALLGALAGLGIDLGKRGLDTYNVLTNTEVNGIPVVNTLDTDRSLKEQILDAYNKGHLEDLPRSENTFIPFIQKYLDKATKDKSAKK